MHSEGDYSPVANESTVSVSVGDALLAERVKMLESLLAEKDERIKDLKDRIDDLKQQI
ncbi:MAG: hypothetical protein HDS67_02375 [Bacteroidales bacterium]|nr:hypothetical protein [Bacteroidales bacterium]